MIITSVRCYAVAAGAPYVPTGAVDPGETLPGSDYYRLGSYPQLYARGAQAAVVRIETEEGIVGWGEAQAPIGTPVILALIEDVLGPAVLGRDPEATSVRFHEMYSTLRVRGQVGGFQLDAIAAIDTALWDIRGKIVGRSIAELLGGRHRDRLTCYVTGLREKAPDGRADEAAAWAEQGVGIKSCLGLGVREDIAEMERLRARTGGAASLLVDALWSYTFHDAVRLGRALADLDIGFLEAPLAPEDVPGHARLVEKLDIPIAVGEPLRHRTGFRPWLEQSALSIAQPDLMRNGVTMTKEISQLAETFEVPVALHLGCTTVIGTAATWQVASTLPNFWVQEFQPVMLDLFNPWLAEPLRLEGGTLAVPTGPGLGIDVDEARIASESTRDVTVELHRGRSRSKLGTGRKSG